MEKRLHPRLFSAISFESKYCYCQQFILFDLKKIECSHHLLTVLCLWNADSDDDLQVSAHLHSDLLFSFTHRLLATAFLLHANLTSKWLFSSLTLILTAKELTGTNVPHHLSSLSHLLSSWMEQELYQSDKCPTFNAALSVSCYCDSEPHSCGNIGRKKCMRQLKLGAALGGPCIRGG
jgi:hypothetical protein